MRSSSFAGRLRGTTSVLALSAAVLTTAPAAAETSISAGIFGGGSALGAQTFRQLFDCYAGDTVRGDGYSFSADFTTEAPSPGLLPTSCTPDAVAVEGLYAVVGADAAARALISNDPHQLLRSFSFLPSIGGATPLFLPAKHPPFVDRDNRNLRTYPYPQLDFTASENPLPNAGDANNLTTVSYGSFLPAAHWERVPDEVPVLARSSASVSYSKETYGAPVQIPAFAAPITVAVNVSKPHKRGVTWTIQSALSPNTQAGGAIQLSTAQLCAIFSGTVQDWSSTAAIAYLDKAGAKQTQSFSDDNTAAGLTPVSYVSGALPITVVYRSDASATTYVLTNYLSTACPLLDNGSNNYRAIFTGVGVTYPGGVETVTVGLDGEGREPFATRHTVTVTKTDPAAANLPSTSFVNLIANIKAVTGTDLSTSWIGEPGSRRVAEQINDDRAHAGHIGYLSADMTKPYSAADAAPLTASIQDELQRETGIYHPGMANAAGAPQNFIAPTPEAAGIAFTSLTPPAPDALTGAFTATYNNWNVYAQVYPRGQRRGGVVVGGLSRLALPVGAGAYPITGTTFLELYSCYSDAAGTRVLALTGFLNWFYQGTDSDVGAVVGNNGFHALTPAWTSAVIAQYLNPESATAIGAFKTTAGATQSGGCSTVTAAHGGAK